MIEKVEKKEVVSVESEPGDGTHYSFIMWADKINHVVYFRGVNSTFNFPNYIPYCDIVEINKLDTIDKQPAYDCNPWTAKECARAAEKYLDIT